MTRHIPLERKDAPGEVTLDDLQKAIEKHAKATGDTITELKAANAKQADKIAELSANLLEVEQKQAARDVGFASMLNGGSDGAAALADELLKNPLWNQVATKQSQRAAFEVKADFLQTKSTITDNGGVFHNVSQSPNSPFGGLERTRFIRDVLPTIPVTTGHVAVTREIAFTNNAAVTLAGSPAVYSEGVAKAESDLTFSTDDLRLPVIAHFLKASNQILADAPRLRQMIDSRLRYGIRVKQDAEIVATMTAGGNFTAFTPSSGDDGIASASRILALLESNDAMGTLFVLNPSTWRGIQRLRSVAGDGQHLIGDPQSVTAERLWGVPVLVSNSMTAGKILALDVQQACEYYERQSIVLDLGYVNDDFTKNLVTIRCEARGALSVIRPVAIAYGDLVQ